MSRLRFDPITKKWHSYEKMPSSGVTIIGDIQPHVTEDITGKPILIDSRRKRKEVCKRYGVIEYSPNSHAKNRVASTGGEKVEWGPKKDRRF